MKMEQLLAEALGPYNPTKLDSSSRGSGLNAVWRIDLPSGPAILKTYSSRRGPVKTVLSCIDHMITGRTGYSAAARHATEQANLLRWRALGLEVPAVLDPHFDPAVPLRHLCMEYVPGRSLMAILADPSASLERKSDIFCLFMKRWSERHELALSGKNARLIQEHATFEHVLVEGDRCVTFDLEVSYRSNANIPGLVAREICSYMRSLGKVTDSSTLDHFLRLLIWHYPGKGRIDAIPGQILRPGCPAARVLASLERARERRRKRAVTKYTVAERLEALLVS